MNKPHKHAELIKAWAEGATIQVRSKRCGEWQEWKEPYDHNLAWYEDPCYEYRIKPEFKPDHYHETRVIQHKTYQSMAVQFDTGPANVRFTFDGETGKLKNVEML